MEMTCNDKKVEKYPYCVYKELKSVYSQRAQKKRKNNTVTANNRYISLYTEQRHPVPIRRQIRRNTPRADPQTDPAFSR